MKWAMEYHSFSMLILTSEDLTILSEAVKEFLFSEADLVASSGANTEDINRSNKTKNILPSLKYFFPAVPKPNEKPRPLTNDQKNQNAIFMRELKKLWKKSQNELNNRILEYVAKGLKAAEKEKDGENDDYGSRDRDRERRRESSEKERRSKEVDDWGNADNDDDDLFGRKKERKTSAANYDPNSKLAKQLESQCLNELALKRLKLWIEEDEDKKVAEETEDALSKLKEAKIAHEQFVKKKDG
jgi:hypothetical protein